MAGIARLAPLTGLLAVVLGVLSFVPRHDGGRRTRHEGSCE